MTKQQYIDRLEGRPIDEWAEFCHEHDIHVRKDIIEPLQKENAELRECLKKLVCIAANRMPLHPTLDELETIRNAYSILEGWNNENDLRIGNQPVAVGDG